MASSNNEPSFGSKILEWVAVFGASLIIIAAVRSRVEECLGELKGAKAQDYDKPKLLKQFGPYCDLAEYRQPCLGMLSNLAGHSDYSLQEFVKDSTKKIYWDEFDRFGNLNVDARNVSDMTNKFHDFARLFHDNRGGRMEYHDCLALLSNAGDEILRSSNLIGGNTSLSDQAIEIRNGLTTAISYINACLDGIHSDVREAVEIELRGMIQHITNALAIVSAQTRKINEPLNSRGPFGATKGMDDGYPAWLSDADRKFLTFHDNGGVKADVVVAKDGSGDAVTVRAALETCEEQHKPGRCVIYVKAGTYDEPILVYTDYIFMYGDGPQKTIITGNRSCAEKISLYRTASFVVKGSGFIAKSIGFFNSANREALAAGAGAVALQVHGGKSVFFNCWIESSQNTLHTVANRQFYRNCVISGSVDIIFGDAVAVIQNSVIIVKMPRYGSTNPVVTAQKRSNRYETTGLVIQNCRIVPEHFYFQHRFNFQPYLGRPSNQYSRTIVMETTLGDFIRPEGWLFDTKMLESNNLHSVEHANRGPGANTKWRVHSQGYKVITNRTEALEFVADLFV